MPAKLSAGLLLYRIQDDILEVLIVHMGGPFWSRKDLGGWSIPKGEYEENEDPFEVAQREFFEELGSPAPGGGTIHLGQLRQPSGKKITIWAVDSDFNAAGIVSNTFEMEWPKGSGKMQAFPEVDRAEWFDCETSRRKLLKGQVPFLDILKQELAVKGSPVRESFGTLL